MKAKVVRVYRANEADTPTIYSAGHVAEAEPALPGWTFDLTEILAE